MQATKQGYRKMFVEVIAVHKPDGSTIPVKFKIEDGRVIPIDRVKYSQRAASTKVGGSGIRYTVMIRGIERYLFEDDGKWFVEARTE